ncbi:MAG TPA: membrane dipeptidase, partial [Candidatus Limnocylindria bacterium]|nr:membrane dipeptidase [Candidatus Limnocylindria bacterium]
MLRAREELLARGGRQTDDPGEAREGECRFMLSLEGCETLGESLAAINEMRRLGVRLAALTWNHENLLGTPSAVNATDGLKPFGVKAVSEMNRLGIAVDVSHLNAAGFYDVLRHSKKPPLASHSCCRALRDHHRNLTDAQVKALFQAGGFIGMIFNPNFLVDSGKPCGIGDVVRHIDHLHHLGGAGMVGFGSDFDGIDTKPDGLANPGDVPALVEALRRRGYSDADVEDIAGKSFLRYFERVS